MSDTVTTELVQAWPLWAFLAVLAVALWHGRHRRIRPVELALHRVVYADDDGHWVYALADRHGHTVTLGLAASQGDAIEQLYHRTAHLGGGT